jgi:hypothetical protein
MQQRRFQHDRSIHREFVAGWTRRRREKREQVIMTRPSDVTDGEMTQYKSLMAKAGLTAEDIYAVNADKSAGHAKIMVDALRAHLVTEAHKTETFEGEEVESTYGYPDGWRLKPLEEQVAILKQHFPGLDVSHVQKLMFRYFVGGPINGTMGRLDDDNAVCLQRVLPKGMDGLVVIPKPSVIARIVSRVMPHNALLAWPEENVALWELLCFMHMTRSDFHDDTERDVGPERYRLTAKTKTAYAAFDNLPGDVMVLAVQTGFLHRGKSVRRARFVFGEREFGLCAFAVGIILLTHPERLTHDANLAIDCAGSEFAPLADDVFSKYPYWYFNGFELRFNSSVVDGPNGRYGSASGCLPEFES